MDTTNDNFTFTCPHCEQHLEAEPDMAGMELDCPTCGQKIIVPVLPSDETESKGLKFVPQMTEIPSVKKEFLKRRWSICSIKLKLAVVATPLLALCVLIICIFGRSGEERTISMYAALQPETVNGITWKYITTEGKASIEDPCGENHYPAIQTSTFGAITIPSTLGGYPLMSIGHSAFKGCCHLTSVTIPRGVTSIGRSAFKGCSALTSVTIPDSVTSIDFWAFEDCNETLFDRKTIPGVKLVDGWVVGYDRSLSGHLDLSGVRGVADDAFWGCSTLTSVVLPNGTTHIEFGTFHKCSALTSVTIPDSVTSINHSAFEDCNEMLFDRKTIPGVKLVDGWVVGYDRSLSGHLDLSGVRGIADRAFMDCSGLRSVIIPNSVTSIGNRAFAHCSALTSVTIPNSVTSIGDAAFLGCSGLTSVTIPNSVTSIGDGSFGGCSGLTSVTIPNSVTNIGYASFGECSGLTSVTIPNSVTSIGDSAFEGCSGLTSVTIPNSVTDIGHDAFKDCNNLTHLPNYVVKLMLKAEKDYEKSEREKELMINERKRQEQAWQEEQLRIAGAFIGALGQLAANQRQQDEEYRRQQVEQQRDMQMFNMQQQIQQLQQEQARQQQEQARQQQKQARQQQEQAWRQKLRDNAQMVKCPICEGSGFIPYKNNMPCNRCGTTGYIRDYQLYQ